MISLIIMTVYALHILDLNEICALSIKGMPGLKEIPTKCPFSWEGERGREVKPYLAKFEFECTCFFNQQVLFSVACGTLTPRSNQMLCGIPFTNFSSLSICSRNVSQ